MKISGRTQGWAVVGSGGQDHLPLPFYTLRGKCAPKVHEEGSNNPL